MRKYNIIWSPNFKRELESIYNYICNKLNAKIIADNLYNQIINQIYSLKYYPERYQKLNIKDENIRRLIVNNYIIIYKINDIFPDQVYILHIFHNNQNYLNLL